MRASVDGLMCGGLPQRDGLLPALTPQWIFHTDVEKGGSMKAINGNNVVFI